jgi:hypothetical protein
MSTKIFATGLATATLLLCLGASGCASKPPLKQALTTEAIGAVQGEIKRQVGIYLRATRAKAGQAAPQSDEFWCGTGEINFDISTVKAELTTTMETITDAGLKLSIPWSAVKIGPSGDAKGDATNTQVLDYNLWLQDPELQDKTLMELEVSDAELQGAPIAQVLLALRQALIDSAKKKHKGPQPCFTDYDPTKPASDAGNTFKLGLTYLSDKMVGLEISVGVIDLTSSVEWKGTTGNTLTVAFIQHDLAKLQYARDAVDTECKYPKKETDEACTKARAAFAKLQKGPGVGIK